MKKKDQDDDLITEINVTPLVDITLVLLIIFMVTATFVLSPSIKVSLPSAHTAEYHKAAPLGIVIDKEDHLYLNGKPVTEAGLRRIVRKKIEEGVKPEVMISADKDVKHGYFVHVIDIIREEGVKDFAINVEPLR